MFCIVSVRGGTWGAGGPHGRRGAVGRGATAPALVWFLRPSAWRRAGDGGQEPWRNAAGSRGTSGLGGSRDTGAPGCRSGGRPHPGDRSVMPLERTVFHARPRVCDAGLVPDTPTTKDGGLGAQEVRARFPASYRARRGRIATLGRGRVSRGPPAPGLLPTAEGNCPVPHRSGRGRRPVTRAGVAPAGEDGQDGGQTRPPWDPASRARGPRGAWPFRHLSPAACASGRLGIAGHGGKSPAARSREHGEGPESRCFSPRSIPHGNLEIVPKTSLSLVECLPVSAC